MGRMPTLSVVIPIFNEEEILQESIEQVRSGCRSAVDLIEIIAVENGSTDRSASILDDLASRLPILRVVHLSRPDYGSALRQGLLAARGDLIVNFSADLVRPDFLSTALYFITRHDIVAASKYVSSAGLRQDPRHGLRRRMGRAYGAVNQIFLDLPLTDTQCIKLYRREVVQPLVSRCSYGGALFDTELMLRAHRSGLRICEIPFSFREVRPSRMGVSRLLMGTIVGLVRLRFDLYRCRV